MGVIVFFNIMTMKIFLITLLLIVSIGFNARPQSDLNLVKSDNVETINGKKYYLHKVEKGQTLFSISKAYQIDVKLLEADSNNIPLKIGQIIKIPFNENVSKGNEKVNYNSILYHTVLSKETLFGISRKYNVDENDLLKANPDVEKNGLKVGQTIIIPQNKANVNSESQKNNNIQVVDIAQKNKVEKTQPKNSINIALLLPLYLKNVGEITTEKFLYNKKTVNDFKSFSFIQFYEGFITAIESLTESGIQIQIHTFDVGEDSVFSESFFKKNEISKMDLIIGPFFFKPFKSVADFAKENKIPIINPFSERINIIENNPYVFKIIPSITSQIENVAKFIVEKYPNANILIVHNNKEQEKRRCELFRKEIAESFKDNNTNEGSIKELIYNQVGFAGFSSKLSKNRSNIIIVLDEKEIFATNFVNKIANSVDEELILIAPLQWKNYDKIETEYFLKVNTHFFEPNFVDYNDKYTQDFIQIFRDKFQTEPNEIAFKGYDIGSFFINAITKFGDNFTSNLNKVNARTLQNNFIFVKRGENNGYENVHTNIYRMQDYNFIKAN